MKRENTVAKRKTKATGETALLETLRVNKLGIHFTDKTTFEDWAKLGESLARADSTLMWCLGDWLAFGECKAKAWGERYTQAVELTGYAYQTLRNGVAVAKAIPLSRRRDKLSWAHHEAVAGLQGKGQEGHEFWLAAAEAHGLSVRELRESIKHGKIMRLADLKELAEGKQGLFTPSGIKTAFTRALAEATKLRKVEEWPQRQRAAWKEQLKPLVEFYEKL